MRKAQAAAQASPHPLPGECPQTHAQPRLCSALCRLHSPGFNFQTDPPPSPQTRNMSLEKVTSSQGNLGSLIAERTDEAAANLRQGEEGGGELEPKEVEFELPINQF